MKEEEETARIFDSNTATGKQQKLNGGKPPRMPGTEGVTMPTIMKQKRTKDGRSMFGTHTQS